MALGNVNQLIGDIINSSDIGPCLGIPEEIFPNGPGFGPIIKGFLGANLAPAVALSDLLPSTIIPVNPLDFPKFTKEITEFAPNLPSLITEGFVVDAPNTPAIEIPGFGKIGGGLVVPPQSVKALRDFILGLITVPLNLFEELIIGPLLEPSIPLPPTKDDMLDLLKKSITVINPPDFTEKFFECLLKAFINVVTEIFTIFIP